jgi:hypothetical protein
MKLGQKGREVREIIEKEGRGRRCDCRMEEWISYYSG